MHDWDLMTNLPGIFAAGDQLFASDCAGFACATGYYAGRKAASWADRQQDLPEYEEADMTAEATRLLQPYKVCMELRSAGREDEGLHWKELNKAISKAMQNYCGGVKCEPMLKEGLDLLETFEKEWVPLLAASNPHDLMRTHEVLDILTVAKMVIYASLERKSSCSPLCFTRSDYPDEERPEEARHILIRQENGRVQSRSLPLSYFGDLKTEYEKRNQDYMAHTETLRTAPVSIQRDFSRDTRILDASLPEIPPLSPVPCSSTPIHYNPELCTGCGRCASVCQCDILMPSAEKGAHPVVMYPGECYYCGACVMVCPVKGAIRLTHPLMNRAKFIPAKVPRTVNIL